MDIKAMAKSKRSHTRRHQPRKQPHPSKTPAPSSSSSASADSVDPKLAKKEGERKRAVQPLSLPSNWDQYEDEGSDDGQQVAELSIDSGSGEPSRLTDSKAKAVPDEVKPKSKGANFGELITQAKESRSSYAPSFHDTLPVYYNMKLKKFYSNFFSCLESERDTASFTYVMLTLVLLDFYQGLGPMLSIRGESILSWEGGDDFLADEEATTTQELRAEIVWMRRNEGLFGFNEKRAWREALASWAHLHFYWDALKMGSYGPDINFPQSRETGVCCSGLWGLRTPVSVAPFLRLDLQDLSKQLAKVDLAKRLFIEPDLLHPELEASATLFYYTCNPTPVADGRCGMPGQMVEPWKDASSGLGWTSGRYMHYVGDLSEVAVCAQGANESDHEMLLEKSKKQKRARVPETFDELLSLYLEEEQNAEQDRDEDQEDANSLTAAISTSSPDPACAANVTDSKLDDIVFQDAREPSSVTLVTKKDSKPSSAFESAAAEAELDMLLNSFSKTKLFDPSAPDSEVATYKKQHETPLPSRENPSPDIPITSSLDDALDNLLEETSKQDCKGSLSQSTEIKAASFELASSTSSLHPSSKSKVLEDFDSWVDLEGNIPDGLQPNLEVPIDSQKNSA
ncbi:hypothetical protein Cgig2_010192 [Carnegiea gigantea]|uniref:Uncharacterized protein n=1 Tax=Carnegiea gigantea TaxID=171969 RepID=A0A9Q1QGK5_9CARY|nr:hypothetical protein Cgig2_010192 [Carnegiea gigantea]